MVVEIDAKMPFLSVLESLILKDMQNKGKQNLELEIASLPLTGLAEIRAT